MKRFVCFLMAALFIFSLFVGCSAKESASDNNGKKTNQTEKTSDKKNKSEIKMDDIDWTVDEGILDGKRYMLFSYTNNSSLTITDIEIMFKEKATVTPEEKAGFFSFFAKELDSTVEELTDTTGNTISMRAESDHVCKPGETISQEHLYYYSGSYYVMNSEYYNFVEPDIAVIKYVSEGKICTVNYDFNSKKSTKENNEEDAFHWSDSELGTILPKPDAEVVEIELDSETIFEIKARGLTLADFEKYMQKCKDAGFVVDSKYDNEDHEYTASNENGYKIELDYDPWNSGDDYMEASIKPTE